MTAEEVNKIFDRQIKKDKIFEVHKELFNLCLLLETYDWKQIRTKEYWEIANNLSYDARKKYTLQCVKKYLKLKYNANL